MVRLSGASSPSSATAAAFGRIPLLLDALDPLGPALTVVAGISGCEAALAKGSHTGALDAVDSAMDSGGWSGSRGWL